MSRRDDYNVRYRSISDILSVATALRQKGGVDNKWNFSIVKFLEFIIKYLKDTISIRIDIFAKKKDEPPAEVVYRKDGKSAVLRISATIWKAAKIDNPFARYVIAHEIGHLILHRHDAKSFSDNNASKKTFYPKEDSAEWQAHSFARLLLVPGFVIDQVTDTENAALACNVEINVAVKRQHDHDEIKRINKNKSYEGENCSECGNFTMVRNGTCLKCDTCGNTSGCS